MALGRCHMVSAVRAGLSRLPFVALLVLAIMALSFVFMMLCRYEQNRRNAGGAGSPQSSAVAYGEELPATGRFTKSITYTCIDAPGRETVSPVVWDDGWFFGDMRTYNHDLARASSVLAALAYSESSHYQESYQTPPYMENALAELGFDEVSTASYEYRSEVMDQMLNLVTQREDTVAYALARKRVTGADGSTRSVILVSVRGSYGSEWLSNLKIEGVSPEGETALSEDQETRYDHSGYVEAASEVSQAVAPWVRESHRRGDQVTLLLVGHSRGGAIANLVVASGRRACCAGRGRPAPGWARAGGGRFGCRVHLRVARMYHERPRPRRALRQHLQFREPGGPYARAPSGVLGVCALRGRHELACDGRGRVRYPVCIDEQRLHRAYR